MTLTATYTLDQTDINGGVTLENCVLVTGDTNADDNCDSYDVPDEPGVNAYKDTVGLTDENNNGRADAGETVTWTITVQNTGNTTLTNVPVSDALTGGASTSVALTDSNGDPFTSPIASIPVGGSVTLTATYTLDQTDINGGVTLENCVLVTGDTNADDNCDSYDVPDEPGVDAAKTSGGLHGHERQRPRRCG